jgi:hypothetical protein
MKWIKLTERCEREQLPHDRQFFCLWKGQFGICEWDDKEELFHICMLPAQMAGIMRVSRDREGKFTHYCLPELPEDY